MTFLITTDEETTKQGARVIAAAVRAGADGAAERASWWWSRPACARCAAIAVTSLFTCVATGCSGAQLDRHRTQRQLGANPLPGRNENAVRAAADRPLAAGRRL